MPKPCRNSIIFRRLLYMSTSFFTYNWRHVFWSTPSSRWLCGHSRNIIYHGRWQWQCSKLICPDLRFALSTLSAIGGDRQACRWLSQCCTDGVSFTIIINFPPRVVATGCLAWDQLGFVRWCVDGDGDVMNVDPLIMTFGVAHGEMGKFVKLNCISHLLSSDFQRVRRQSCPFSLLYQIQYVVLHRWSLIVSFGTGATSSSY